jgi:hypothetical protein
VQDAATVITEAIDPEAKVIFGAVNDESLKKGQIRVTVIATGFPEPAMKPPVTGTFAPRIGSTLKDKDQDVPPATVRLSREEARRRSEPAAPEKDRTEKDQARPPIVIRTHETPATRPESQNMPIIEDSSVTQANPDADDDTWGGLPSFLRRR